ncbi:MAG TPA: hypothetical protein VMW55_10065 [Nitrosopumilaceae archaeon]|nr:hypothetical protein [Nitrosopumilaceae archaeon]
MNYKPSHVLIFGLLIAGVGHIMIIQNGYWDNSIWLISIPSVIIPVTIYYHMKNKEKRNKARRVKKYEDI